MSSRKRKQEFFRKTLPGTVVLSGSIPPGRAKRRRFTPGVDRVGGFYGRYSGKNAELKFHDIDVDQATVAIAGNIMNGGTINIIPQDVTEITRIGRKCTIRSIHWKYNVTLQSIDGGATPQTGDTVRIILYQDKQANGATATVINILASADYQSFRNLVNSGRFIIHMDKTVDMNPMGLGSDGAGLMSTASVEKHGVFNKTCSVPLEFDAASGAMGTTRSNTFGVMLISKVAKCDFVSKVRLRFSDQ